MSLSAPLALELTIYALIRLIIAHNFESQKPSQLPKQQQYKCANNNVQMQLQVIHRKHLRHLL